MTTVIPPQQTRPSKSMVIGTIFDHRRDHVWLCIQHDRLSTKPTLLIKLSVLTYQLINEMRFDLVGVTLKCDELDRPQFTDCSLQFVPIWTVHCNDRKLVSMQRRKACEKVKLMLKLMQSTTVGARVMLTGFWVWVGCGGWDCWKGWVGSGLGLEKTRRGKKW
ncbi:protein MIZU-KUSSEI 1-like [Pyrus communis]|uniref:protein MIZU-KUSSEI 1-like n=1 Tax=Pyrus communis TaxID=23211 RepID=UPI0035C14685